MLVAILGGFLLIQIVLIIIWYRLIKLSKKKKINPQEIATQKYMNKLQKKIEIEYHI